MRRFGKALGRVLLVVVLGFVGLFVFGPRTPGNVVAEFDQKLIGDDPVAYFGNQEARFSDITPGAEKRIVWAGDQGQVTAQSVVFIHGFSATSEEIRPVPDLIATHLGANLVYTRLVGHGRGDNELDNTTVQAWYNDLAEAMAVARLVGNEVIVISNSTGGTLVGLAATGGDDGILSDVKASIFMSPNFALNSVAAPLLTQGGAEWYLPLLIGKNLSFDVKNEMHELFWTNRYPSRALLPVAAAVEEFSTRDHSIAAIPALWIFSDEDQVIDHRETRRVAAQWGGGRVISTLAPQDVPEGNDPYQHVIAGDVMSPGMTGPVVDQIIAWVDALQ